MQIVTDSGTDVNFTPEQIGEYNVHVVPLVVSLAGKSYREGIDIQADELYLLLEQSNELPITSQPSAGEFAALYREMAKTDPDILSINGASPIPATTSAAIALPLIVRLAMITPLQEHKPQYFTTS